MVGEKTPLSTKTTVSSVDKVVSIRNDGTGDKVVLVSVENLAAQVSLSAAGGLLTSTWAELDAIDGTTAGQAARVIGDTGTHTDPVVGGTVSNSGEFSWSASPAGWQRIGDLPPGTSEIDAAVASEAIIRSAADANLQTEIDAIIQLPSGVEVAMEIDEDPPLGWYDTGARIAAVPSTRAFLSNRRPIDLDATVYWVDVSDKSTLFQDAGLTTPVEADGDPVYAFVMKDNIGTFSEVVDITNPRFDSDLTGWTTASGSGGTAAWNESKARITRTTTVTSISQSISLTAGRLYTITARATWISGSTAQASIVLRTGAAAGDTVKGQKLLAAGASGVVSLTYVPDANEVVYLHLTCGGGAGAIDFDDVSASAGDKAIFMAVTNTALGTYHTDGGRHWIEINEDDDEDDRYVCSQIKLGGATFKGGVCIGYRQNKPEAAWIWTSSLVSGDGNTAGLRSFNLTGDGFVIGGSSTVLADRGLRDKAAYLWWDKNTNTGIGGRTKDTLSAAAVGSSSDDTALYIGARGNATPGAPIRVYDFTVIIGDISTEERDWLIDFTNARSNVRYPTQINVILAAGQSNSDNRAALSDSNAPAGWNDDKKVPGVWNWNGSEISDTYWLFPVGSTQCGASWSDGQAGASKFGFIDVACAEMAETIPNLVVCRVTQGGTGVDTGANTDGSWHTPSSELPSGTPSLFDALKNKFLALQTFCAEHAIRCNVLGMFWHQGENAKLAPTNFKVDTEAVFAGVREFVGDEDLPIVTGTIPTESAYYSLAVKNDMLAIDAADDRTTYLDFSALTTFDGTHFNAASNVTAGGNAATEMMTYVGDSYLVPSGTGSIVGAGFPDLGVGVATALVQDIGSAGGLVVGGGALGTPASGNLENCTGLPLSGISDFGTGVAAAAAIAAGATGGFAIIRPDIDVTDSAYGAVGSNTAGDGTKIQTALDDAIENGVALYLPEGDWLLDTSSAFGYGMIGRQTAGLKIRIYGDGQGKTILRAAALSKTGVLGFKSSALIEIHDLSIEGADQTGGSGIYCEDCSDIAIENVGVANVYNNGMLFNNECIDVDLRNIFIDTPRNAGSSSSGGHGIAFSGDDTNATGVHCERVRIEDIRIRKPHGSGVNLSEVHDAYVRGVRAYWEGGTHPSGYGAVRCTNGAENLRLYDITGDGMGRCVFLSEVRTALVKNCHAVNSRYEGFIISSDDATANDITAYGLYSYNSGQAEDDGSNSGIVLTAPTYAVTNVRIFDARIFSNDGKMEHGVLSSIGTSNLTLGGFVDVIGASVSPYAIS